MDHLKEFFMKDELTFLELIALGVAACLIAAMAIVGS